MWTFVALALYYAFSLTSSAHDDTNSSLTFFGFDTQAASLVVNGANFWEISGLCYNDDDENATFYAISDTISYLVSPSFDKSIFKLTFDFSNFAGVDTGSALGAMDVPTGITMEQPDVNDANLTTIDTESIAYFDAVFYQGVVIVNEGYRQYDRTTEFMVYNVDGSYIDAAEYDRVTFEERGSYNDIAETYADDATGLQENGGFEAVTITEDYDYIVYVASVPLIQDLDECTDCVRLVVTPLDVDSDGNLTFGVDKQFRYDVHRDASDEEVVVRDITSIDGLDTLLVLESYIYPALDEFNMTYFRVRVYEIGLADILDDSAYYFDCFALDNCSSTMTPVESDLVIDFEADLSEINGIEYLYFDALTRGPEMSALGVNTTLIDDCEDDSLFILAATDNDEESDTYFVYFCYSTTDTSAPTSSPTPLPTASDDSGEGSTAIMYSISYVYYLLMIMLFKFVL